MPLLTVVIACLNDREHLPRAVTSVLNQTFSDLELVVMDGGSEDGTVSYLRGIHDGRLVWRSEPDDGITQAWNKAIAIARGEWLLFLGADDYIWDTGVIDKAVPILTADARATLAFGEVWIVAAREDRVVQKVRLDKQALLAQLRGSSGLGLPHQGFFHRRHALAEKPFDPSFRLAADYEFITRFSAPEDFVFLPIGPVAAFRMGGLSTDPWVALEASREWARIHRLRGRNRMHGARERAKAYAKVFLRFVFGQSTARALVNATRSARNLPPYQE